MTINENEFLDWNKDNLRNLRLRLGWSKSDLARRLKCSISDVDAWEEGTTKIEFEFKGELEIMLRQCQECSDEVKNRPASDEALDKNALGQIDFSRVNDDFK